MAESPHRDLDVTPGEPHQTIIGVCVALLAFIVLNAAFYPGQPRCDVLRCGIADAWSWAFVPARPLAQWQLQQQMYQGYYGQVLIAAAIVLAGALVLAAGALVYCSADSRVRARTAGQTIVDPSKPKLRRRGGAGDEAA